MKITAKNLVEKWDEIKDMMPDYVTVPSSTYLELAYLYDDFDEETRIKFDAWLDDINTALAQSAPKPADTPKPSTPKPDKEDKPKPEKPSKPKKEKTEKKPRAKKEQKAEAPDYLKVLTSFVKSYAGQQNKDTWRVSNFVKEIQVHFSVKRDNKTPKPFIDLIRKIQSKLLKFANSDEKKVSIPDYSDLVKDCKKAIKEKNFTASSKVKKADLKEEKLSGFSIGFKGLQGFKIGFKR